MRFTIEFHGPFHIATGFASDELDLTVDESDPVPASSLKGLMRAWAETIARAGHADTSLVGEVFGSKGAASPWSWEVHDVHGLRRHRRARLAIEPDGSYTADERALLFAEEFWAERASLTVEPIAYIEPARRPLHEALLTISACAVKSIGADRNRGYGWISVIADEELSPGAALALMAEA